MRIRRNGLVVCSLLALAGCPDRSVAVLDPVETGEVDKDIPVTTDIDVLFVIDSSASTNDKQTVFAANFPRFVDALDGFAGGRPNLHIGVVSTSVDIGTDSGNFGPTCHPAANDDGRLHNAASTPGCPVPTDRFISDLATPTGRQTNYPATATLSDTLSCIAQIGAAGCGFEAPLEAMKRALDGSRPENAGFLRDGAYLAVIILTDEDDCSVEDSSLFTLTNVGTGDFRCQPMVAYTCDTPISSTGPGTYTNCAVRRGSYLKDPSSYAEFLGTVKPPGHSVVAVIGGDRATTLSTGPITDPFKQDLALLPSCEATLNGNHAIGRPANRLGDFVDRFGADGLFRSVCQSDYSNTLSDIGKLLFTELSPCLVGDLVTTDRDADNPGVQLDCTVSDIQLHDTGEGTEQGIPACEMAGAEMPDPGGSRPCWWVASNPTTCTTATGLELHVERNGSAPTGTATRVRCASN